MTYDQWCDAVQYGAKTMPEDPFAFVAALQMLGNMVVENHTSMKDEQMAEMIGVGALLYREMMRIAREEKPLSKAIVSMVSAGTKQ